MKRALTALLTALPLLLASPAPAQQTDTVCPPEMKAAFEQYILLPSRLLPVLESVRDTAGADAAAPLLHEQLEAVYNAGAALRAIPSLTAEQADYVQQHYARRMREEWGKVYDCLFRLQKAQCYHSVPFTKEFGNLNMMLSR